MFTLFQATSCRTITFPFKSIVTGVLCLVLSWISILNLIAQPAKEWDKGIGGSSGDELTTMERTVDGGYILGGWSTSPISGDKTENSRGGYGDYWIVKLNAAGMKEWDRTFGGSNEEYLTSVEQTADGGYIVGGYSNSQANGDKSEKSKGSYDYWVLKLNASGNKEWDKTIGANSTEELYAVRQTADGGYILGGWSSSPISGDKSDKYKGGYSDYWIVKLKADGSKEWDKSIGGSSDDFLESLQVTADGGYILAGHSYSNTSGDKSENTKGSYSDFWVVKLNAAGSKEWDKTLGGSGIEDNVYSLQQTKDGGYIVGGTSESKISFDKSENARGGYGDYWVIKLNASGTKEWDKTFGGNETDELQSVKQTQDGGYILGGSSWSNAGFDKSDDARSANSDYWVVKVDASGNKEWDKTLGGYHADKLHAVQQAVDGGYLLGGESVSEKSGDKSGDLRLGDFWIVKLTPYSSADPTIRTGDLSSAAYCAGSTLEIPFVTSGTFDSNVKYEAQISDATGSFNSARTIGTGTTSPINATIPTDLTASFAYRIRVISTLVSVVIGADNRTNVSISTLAPNQPVYIDGDFMPRVSTSEVYTIGPAASFKNCNWKVPSGWTITAGQGTNSVTVTVGNTAGSVTVEAVNLCGVSMYGQFRVEPLTPPVQPSAITASATTVCPGDTITYTTNPGTQMSYYQGEHYNWTVPYGWTILNNRGTNSITVKAGVQPGTVMVYVTNYYGTSAPIFLPVNSSGPASPRVTPAASCGKGSVTLVASGASLQGSYRWYTTSTGATAIPGVTAATFTTPVLTATTTYYVSIVTGTCESARVPVIATINVLPQVKAIASSYSITVGEAIFLQASGAVSYQWFPATGLGSTTEPMLTATPRVSTVYTVTGTDAKGCVSRDSVVITVNKPVDPATRINAGAAAYQASGDRLFLADQYFGGTNGTSSLPSGDILNTTDDELYRSERSSAAFTYSIPVKNGPVNVVLHFAEIWFGVPGRGTGGVGSRRFNVDVEGSRKLTNYDIFAKAGGALRALQEAIPVMVTDGVLNINFTSGAANKPKLSAIEIIPMDALPNVAPKLAGIGSKTVKVNQVLSFTATATDANVDQTKAYSLVDAPSGAAINSASGVFTWTPNTAGTFTLTVRVTDNGSPVMVDEEQITITVQNNTLTAIRLNSGGKAVSTSLGSFSADTYLTGTTEVSTKVVALANTTDDVLYQDYRKASALKASFGYSVPVANGTYTVKLHFAEVFYTAKGKRIFHVNAEGVRWLTNYDIFAAAGGANRAVVASRTVTVTDGKLEVVLTSVTDRASISALEVLPVSSAARIASNRPKEAIAPLEARLYPNPASDKLTVRLADSTPQVFTTITDVTGVVLGRNTHRRIDDNTLEISVTILPPAIYLLQIQTNQGWQTLKFVKQ